MANKFQQVLQQFQYYADFQNAFGLIIIIYELANCAPSNDNSKLSDN